MTGHGRAKNMDISDYFLGWNVEITQIPLITIMTIIVDGMFRYVPVLVIWESMVLTLQGFKGSIHAAREYPLSWHCETYGWRQLHPDTWYFYKGLTFWVDPLKWAQPISCRRGRGSTYPFLAGLRHARGVVVGQLKEVLHACHALPLPLPTANDAVQLVCGDGRTKPQT